MDINLTVDIGDLDLNERISAYYYDDEGDRVDGGTVAQAVIAKLVEQATKGDYYNGLKKRVQEIRDEQIRAQIEPVVAEAVTAPIVKTNMYGEATGAQTTLRELIMQQVRQMLGMAADGAYRGGGSYERSTVLVQMIRAAVNEALKAEIADAVTAAREGVAAEFGKSVSEVVTEAVRTGLRAKA